MNTSPAATSRLRRDRRRVADDRDGEVLRAGCLDRASPGPKRVDAARRRVDQGGVVVRPPGLVLLRAVMVVDTEDHDVAGPGRERPGEPVGEVERGPAAVGANLDDGGVPRKRGRLRHKGEGEALLVRHEALSGPGGLEQALRSRRPVVALSHRRAISSWPLRRPSRRRGPTGRPRTAAARPQAAPIV